MRLSKKQRQGLYSAIAQEIATTRVNLKASVSQQLTRYGGGTISADTVDAELYYLEKRACAAAITEIERDARTGRRS